MKICIRCKISKPIEKFSNKKSYKDGKCPYCNDCKHNMEKERRKLKGETHLAKQRKYYKTFKEKYCSSNDDYKNTRKFYP